MRWLKGLGTLEPILSNKTPLFKLFCPFYRTYVRVEYEHQNKQRGQQQETHSPYRIEHQDNEVRQQHKMHTVNTELNRKRGGRRWTDILFLKATWDWLTESTVCLRMNQIIGSIWKTDSVKNGFVQKKITDKTEFSQARREKYNRTTVWKQNNTAMRKQNRNTAQKAEQHSMLWEMQQKGRKHESH